MNIKQVFMSTAALALCVFGAGQAQAGAAGAVYTMTNAADDNMVVAFSRDAHGLLTKTDAVSTGGKGSGGGVDPLGSQGSLVLASRSWGRHDGEWLLAVNAGSNDISVFHVGEDGIRLRDRTGSGGTMPVSVTVSGNIVYVLNEGAPANISGFWLGPLGHLHYLPNSTRMLGSGAYGQVAFDPDGKALIVTDKADNALLVFPTGLFGLPAMTPVVTASAGNVPFGVTFDGKGHVLVVEAGTNAVSSYRLLHNGTLQTISASVPNGQIASCWISIDQNGEVITTNPGTQSLSTFRVHPGTGNVMLLNGTAGAGTTPLDVDVSDNGRYVYAVDPGIGGVDMYKLENNGSLTSLGSVDGGLSAFAQGMAAR